MKKYRKLATKNKIQVQPDSVKRRNSSSKTKQRVKPGPSKTLGDAVPKPKRKHNLSLTIKNNEKITKRSGKGMPGSRTRPPKRDKNKNSIANNFKWEEQDNEL